MKLAERMWSQGPYLSLHLRLEIDVWIRTGCLPGLGKEFDAQIRLERKMHPNLLTARGAKLGFTERKMAGLCPLTGAEVARYSLIHLPLNLILKLALAEYMDGYGIW